MIHKFLTLRKQFPVFTYDSFSYTIKSDCIEVEYIFIQSQDIIFHPSFQLFLDKESLSRVHKNLTFFEDLFFQIGMVELVSYWKACASPEIIIKPRSLSSSQIKFWYNLYYQGLGEYLYQNKIDKSLYGNEICKIIPKGNTEITICPYELCWDNNIIPIGGGKDSVVSLEVLKRIKDQNRVFILNPRIASLEVAKKGGYNNENILTCFRRLDPLLLSLNSQGYLNGHTPFSALLAFYSALVTVSLGYRNIVLSNENSANEGNVLYHGLDVNHQYSKSFLAEESLVKYFQNYISKDLNYFSLLRPLKEVKIAAAFASCNQYFSVFKSCNRGSKTDSWCCQCPKCLFVYLILSPFLDQVELENIFGENMLDKVSMEKDFRGLLGIGDVKPFECVGTYQDVLYSLQAISEKHDTQNLYLVELYKKLKNKYTFEIKENPYSFFEEKKHFLSKKYLKMLKNYLKELY